MNILIITAKAPMPDRASGDLRFFTMLRQLCEFSQLTLCAYSLDKQHNEIGAQETNKYLALLEKEDIQLGGSDVISTLRCNRFDAVIFEFYHYFGRYINSVRLYQPNASVIIDSVDIHYKRFHSKALLTQSNTDLLIAKTTKLDELKAYSSADMVICVTTDDKTDLNTELPNLPTLVIPNIHELPAPSATSHELKKLLFVGSFDHEPNIDAVLFFCQEIMPLLLNEAPFLVLDIIGPNPPESILKLQNDSIIIHGRVANLGPYYSHADIVLAPLRFGAGMKGKVGEAMSYSLPVVTTTIGAEGFGVTHGSELLIADDPLSFSNAVLSLINNPKFAHEIGEAGFSFIQKNYSYDSNKSRIEKLVMEISQLTPKRISVSKRTYLNVLDFYNRHLAWRFNKNA